MGKKATGLMAGKKLVKRRKQFKFKRKGSRLKKTGGWKKYDPLEGSPMAAGIVLKKKNVECKQPHSGLRKCAVVQLIKNGKSITAFMPGEGALKYVDEHDTVMVQRIGGPMGKSAGDIPGVKFKVVKTQEVSLPELIKGRKEKPHR
jgi:small subunit ribosomal protein S12